MSWLAPRRGGLYVDGTFGGGGYSTAILGAADCQVVGIDRDPAAIVGGATIARQFPGCLTLIEGCFGNMAALLAARGLRAVDGVTLDLGVSAWQLDTPERGFSFRYDGPLDMRMGQSGQTAAEIVNTCSESTLTSIIRALGEEPLAHRVARAIIAARPITSTAPLAALIRRVVPRPPNGIDPATRTFQALRAFVNDEPGELYRALLESEKLLVPGSRLVIVAFHSLDDRAIKRFFRDRAGHLPHVSRHWPETPCVRPSTFRILTRCAVRPSAAERVVNPRARSARLRAAERTAAPPWPYEALDRQGS
ncbi:rRNA small subunit methyltransferase H [invertebrate metagenome]|uniref:rRNA small subunit methyltransferase H n=1 Tax=invertebrate metagenome TaxID=1711999 RepID=A0A484H4U6_9ZZZZ